MDYFSSGLATFELADFYFQAGLAEALEYEVRSVGDGGQRRRLAAPDVDVRGLLGRGGEVDGQLLPDGGLGGRPLSVAPDPLKQVGEGVVVGHGRIQVARQAGHLA